jgi:hypothetical protein
MNTLPKSNSKKKTGLAGKMEKLKRLTVKESATKIAISARRFAVNRFFMLERIPVPFFSCFSIVRPLDI